ncbi:hypothetical protein [Wolbachia endosymbiont of Pentidionis agamae]|uniref:hypothetical protein n=1 Tax=Wolbachia endosymbiont of Pentidionis agamae TaxID=3110435 RepID=UPI002FD5B096
MHTRDLEYRKKAIEDVVQILHKNFISRKVEIQQKIEKVELSVLRGKEVKSIKVINQSAELLKTKDVQIEKFTEENREIKERNAECMKKINDLETNLEAKFENKMAEMMSMIRGKQTSNQEADEPGPSSKLDGASVSNFQALSR